MNLLQLYIAKSLRGYKSLVSFNATDDVARRVGDLRRALEAIDYDPAEKIIVYLVSYIPEGTLLSILRTIPSEPLDHLAATIFVPAAADISAAQLDKVASTVARKISASSMKGEDVGLLRSLFATEYPTLTHPRTITPSTPAGGFGVEYYGGRTGTLLEDFLDNGAYVPELASGAGTLLVDAELLPPARKQPMAEAPAPGAAAIPAEAPKPAPKAAAASKPETKDAPPQPGGTFSLRQLLIACGVSLVLGIILGFCLFAGGSDEKVGRREPAPAPDTVAAAPSAAASMPKATHLPAEAPAAPEQAASQATTTGVEAAVAYLDANSTWRRDAMEKHAAIAGLFDDLNSMDIARITDHWGPKLKGSKNFSAVVRAAAGSKRKNVNVHREGRATYNKPGDTAIAYVGYTFWIDP